MSGSTRRDDLSTGVAISIALTALLLGVEQVLNLAFYRIAAPWSALAWYAPVFLFTLGVFLAARATGVLAARPTRFSMLMGLPVLYIALVGSRQIMLCAGQCGPQGYSLAGWGVLLIACYGLLVFPRWGAGRFALTAGFALHAAAVFSWLVTNPERFWSLGAGVSFSLQVGLIGFLLIGCFWTGVRLPAVRAQASAVALVAALVLVVAAAISPLDRSVCALPEEARGEGGVASDLPDVVWIVLDTLRSDHLPTYGYERDTAPFLSRLARQSTVYENAISTAGWTLPSHASMFTGLFSREHGAHWINGTYTVLDEGKTSIAEILRDAGYRTAGFSANLGYVTPSTGLAQGFDFFCNFDPVPHFMLRADLVKYLIYHFGGDGWDDLLLPYPSAPTVTGAALEWITAQGDAPWFAFLNYMEAHRPHVPPAFLRDMFPGRMPLEYDFKHRLREITARDLDLTPEDIAHLNSQYDAQIRAVDGSVERLLDRIESRGGSEPIVIITADHGEYLGEHGRVSHGQGLYDELLRVPLIVRSPTRAPGVERALTSTVEIPAILLAELPLEQLTVGPEHGAQIEALLERRRVVQENGFIVAELQYNSETPWKIHGGGYAVHGGRFKFVSSRHGGEELYDLESEAGESANVIDTYPEEAKRLRGVLHRYKGTFRESRGATFEEQDLEALKALGYVAEPGDGER